MFNDGANQVDEELSHIYYHHQCPDYRLIAQPIASYLMPLWTMDDMSSLSPAEIYSSCAVIPQETLERDLRNFIFNIFVVYRKMPEKCYSYRMWYALGIMEHFRMEHCLDIVLEVLRQDLDFYDFYFGYLYETMLSAITIFRRTSIFTIQQGNNRNFLFLIRLTGFEYNFMYPTIPEIIFILNL